MTRHRAKSLTGRQKQVITLARQGRTIGEISNELGIHPHTVQIHLCNAYKKLGIPGKSNTKKNSLMPALGELLDRLEKLEAAARTAGWDV